jgi:hypothetical protein
MALDVEILIHLFAENSLENIQNGGLIPLIHKYYTIPDGNPIPLDWGITNISNYPQIFDQLKYYKKRIEEKNNASLNLSNKTEVSNCLEICWEEVNDNQLPEKIFNEKMSIFLTLVTYMYEKKWSPDQKNHFKLVSTIFCEYNYYFLSYTNHDAYKINKPYSGLIEEFFPEECSPSELRKKNFVAKAIHKQICRNNLKKGFFDRDSIRMGEEIPEKVMKNIEKSITLIQLLSSASFEHTIPNWSFDEYKGYISSKEKLMTEMNAMNGLTPNTIFLIIEKDPFPAIIPPEYQGWYDDINNKLHFIDFFAKTETDSFRAIVKQIVAEIRNSRIKLTDCVPD